MAFGDGRANVTKLAAAIVLAMAAPFAQGAADRDGNIEARLLASHNRERAARGVAPLAWSAALAHDAQAYARHLARVGRLVHSQGNVADRDPDGENLWAGSRGYYTPEAMVGLWVAEKSDFKPGVFPDNSISGNLDKVGHYTQLMWRSSRAVGCAVAEGGDNDFLVCRYSEGGNVIGERPF